jgi:hypothetical protein
MSNCNFKRCIPSQLALAQHLFIDAMEAEALKRSEGDRDKLRNTFRIMWGRPEGAKARKAAEEQASRIWAWIPPREGGTVRLLPPCMNRISTVDTDRATLVDNRWGGMP